MRLFIARIACSALAAALATGAATLPSRAGPAPLPPGAGPTSPFETIRGVIEAILGPYHIRVRDNRGFIDDVTLRAGTMINPRGLRLAVGMHVTIRLCTRNP